MLAEVPEGPQKPRLPGILFRIVIVLAFFVLGAQLWRLQIVEGSTYREKADNNRIRKATIPPSRGIIYDRNGLIVAANAPIFVVSIVPADLPKGRETPVYMGLQELLDANAYTLQEAVNHAREEGDVFTPIRVKSNV